MTPPSPPDYQSSSGRRAWGTTLIAILLGLFGLLTLFAGLIVLIGSSLNQGWGKDITNGSWGFLTANGTIIGAIIVIIGLIYLAVAVGLFRQHMWSLVLVFIIGFVTIISEIWNTGVRYVNGSAGAGTVTFWGAVIVIVILALFLSYLASVRDDFI